MLIKQESFNWFDVDDDNIDQWYREAVVNASKKRILITK